MITLRALALLLLALCVGTPVSAREIPVQTCIARLNPGETPQRVAMQTSRFDCHVRQNALGSGNFISELRFSSAMPEPGDGLVLRTASVWQDWQRIRFRFADGSEAVRDMAANQASRQLALGAQFEFPVPPKTVPLTSVLIETRGSANVRGVVLGARLMAQSDAHRLNLLHVALYAGFAGLALALLVYNLSLWRALRTRFQFYYCMMVAALAGYAFTSSGALALILPAIDNNDRLRLNHLMLTLSALAGLRFIRKFFEREVDDRWLDRTSRWLCWAALAVALAFALFAPWQIAWLDKAYFITMSALIALVVPVLVLAYRRRARHFALFVAAWGAPLVISILRAAIGFNLFAYHFWLDNGNLAAMAIEALLSSLLVTARVREISQERDHAVRGERTARRLAGTDALTGLLNRRAFLDLAIGRRAHQRLMVIDIDHFKAVNDRYGHDLGDQVLVEIADVVQSCRPSRSLAVRLGGEEFALLMPYSLADKCSAEMILQAVRDKAMPQGLRLTVSIGVSEGHVSTQEDWKRLYRLADAALYRAKADGRDRFCRATDFRAAA